MTFLHATGVYWKGTGIVMTGASGSGKSDLALRLLSLGADLISDDYVDISKNSYGHVMMRTPPQIAGKIEVHNVGILEVPYQAESPVDLILQLVSTGDVAQLTRLPEPQTFTLEGVEIPSLDFYAFEASAPDKIRAALKILLGKY